MNSCGPAYLVENFRSLQEHIDLPCWLLQRLLDGDRHPFDELGHLQLLLITDNDVLELIAQAEKPQQLNLALKQKAYDNNGQSKDHESTMETTTALLFHNGGGAVGQVSTALAELGVTLGLVDWDTVKLRVAEHPHIPVRHSLSIVARAGEGCQQ
eukprot:scaffold152320_cov47-Prasinocladus_malaysianus.AAC.1